MQSWQVNSKSIHLVESSKNIARIFHPTAVNGLLEVLPLLCGGEKDDSSQQVGNITAFNNKNHKELF